MILTLGSSSRAASQSVETSGSSEGDVMRKILVVIPGCVRSTQTRNPEVISSRFRVRAGARPGMTKGRLSLLLRLELLHRTAGGAPGGKAAAHVGDRLQSHVLRGFRRQCGAHAAGAMK